MDLLVSIVSFEISHRMLDFVLCRSLAIVEMEHVENEP